MNILAFTLLLAAELGSVSFPATTKHPAAQAELERGLAALHSFWYEEAAASFRRAQQLDPQLAMAFWGEAMTHNHPIWQEQDREAARAILARCWDGRGAAAQQTVRRRKALTFLNETRHRITGMS
jgi:Tfp pilus assembly protein PilF